MLRELVEKNPHLKSQTAGLYDELVSEDKNFAGGSGRRGSNRVIPGKGKGGGGNQMMGADQFVIDN
jgi:hypothetical protein